MENNTLEILKLFTRKLVNCRYKVSAKKLAEYLDGGEFGYSFDESKETIITNDSVFASDVALVVDRIRAIYSEPHITLRRDETVLNVSVASKFDNRSIQDTYKDEKLWRIRFDQTAPEFIHSYVHDENLATYENRFVTFLLDYILDAINKKLNVICGNISTFNKKIDKNENTAAYSSDVYLGYTENVEKIPVLATLDDPETNVISSLTKSKAVLSYLRSYEIYKACKKVGFIANELKPTNILLNEENYNYCYKFFTTYIKDVRFITTQSKMYQGFIFVNMLAAIFDAGYVLDENASDVLINDSAEIRFETLTFKNDLFTLNLTARANGLFVIDARVNPDGETARYVFKVVSSSLTSEFEGLSAEEYAKYIDENRIDGITRTFLITDVKANSDNVVYVSPEKSTAKLNIIKVIKTITMLVQGVNYIHSKYCPVCGSQLVSPVSRDYVCSCCNSTYHIFNYEFRDLIWLKRLPNIAERKAIADVKAVRIVEEPVAERVEPVPAPAEPVAQPVVSFNDDEIAATADVAVNQEPELKAKRRVVTKSFEGKMRQASKEQKGFYGELKNYLLSFKRVNSRLSWSCDSFNIGREKAVKIGFRGQTMVAYFALNPADYEGTKYYPHDMGEKKKFEETPMMIKIKSERGVKFAKELIDAVCKDLVAKKDFVPEKYSFPYMSDKKLIENGLAKESYVNL